MPSRSPQRRSLGRTPRPQPPSRRARARARAYRRVRPGRRSPPTWWPADELGRAGVTSGRVPSIAASPIRCVLDGARMFLTHSSAIKASRHPRARRSTVTPRSWLQTIRRHVLHCFPVPRVSVKTGLYGRQGCFRPCENVTLWQIRTFVRRVTRSAPAPSESLLRERHGSWQGTIGP